MELIAQQVISANTNLVTLSSIPQTFRDLMLVIDAQGTAASVVSLRVNGDNGSNYNGVEMAGNGSSASSGQQSGTTLAWADWNAQSLSGSIRSVMTLHALDYSTSNKHKTFLWRGGRADGWVNVSALRWASNAAITSISISSSSFNPGTNWLAGSIFTLYGISA